MRNILLLLFLIIIQSKAFPQSYPSATGNVQVPNNIEWLKHTQKIISGSTVDPSSVATSAGAGSVLMKTDGSLFLKKDAGLTTNWEKLVSNSADIITKLGFTPENVANKSTSTTLGTSDTLYPTQNAVKSYVDEKKLSAGATTLMNIVDNGGGNITSAALDVSFNSLATAAGTIRNFTLGSLTATLTDGVTNYVVANYNNGSPIQQVITDVSLINETTIVPIATIYRSGSFLHTLSWDTLGNGLSNKIHQSIVKTQRYRRESGLALSESGTRNVDVSSGIMWVGANSVSILAAASATDNLFYFLRTGPSAWTTQVLTQYNNNDYFNGTTTVALTNNRYAVNWIYRGVESQKHIYVVLGEGDYTLTQAQTSQPPANLPQNITSHAALVGRIIVLKGASTATQIDSAFALSFTGSGVTDHNSLSGLQGGTTNEYYHLTSAGKTAADTLTGTANYVSKFTGTGLTASQIFDNGTNVGIGTSTPSTKLEVNGNTTLLGPVELRHGSASGSFKIGADVNTSNLTLNTRKIGRITAANYTNGLPISMIASDSGATDSAIFIGGNAGSSAVVAATKITFMTGQTATTTAGTEHMALNNVGYLGLGTTTPAYKFHVENSADSVSSGEHIIGILRRDSNGGGFLIGYRADGSAITANTMRGSGNFDTWIGSSAYPSALSILNANGNVGIGNTAPAVKLDVTGDVAVSGYTYFGSPSVNGSYRMFVSGTALVTQKRVSGVWTEVARLDND